MDMDNGRLADATGLSPTVEPASSLDGSATSIPSADGFAIEYAAYLLNARLLWRGVQRDEGCDRAECVDYDSPNCHCNATFRHFIASAIEARSGETRGAGLDPKDESAVAASETPENPNNNNIIPKGQTNEG